MIHNLRKKVKKFDCQKSRFKDLEIEFKLYFQVTFVMLLPHQLFDFGSFPGIWKITKKTPKLRILCWRNFIFRSLNMMQYLSELDEKWMFEKVNICSFQVFSSHLGENSIELVSAAFSIPGNLLKFRNFSKFWNQQQNNFIFKKSYTVEYSSDSHEK